MANKFLKLDLLTGKKILSNVKADDVLVQLYKDSNGNVSAQPDTGFIAMSPTEVQSYLVDLYNQIKLTSDASKNDLDNHINNTTDAHDASAISVSSIEGVTGSDVQNVLVSLKGLIDTLSTGLSSEQAARTSGDAATLADAKSYTDSELSAHESAMASSTGAGSIGIDTAGTNYSSSTVQGALTEIDTELGLINQDYTGHINGTSDRHSAEDIDYTGAGYTSSATNVKEALDTLSTSVSDALTEAKGYTDQKVAQEVSDRTNADTTLQQNIDAVSSTLSQEVIDMQNDQAALELSLNNEISRATNAEGALQTAINNEVTNRQSADNQISSNLAQEITDRQTGDANTLISAKAYADEKINQSIAAAVIYKGTISTSEEYATALSVAKNGDLYKVITNSLVLEGTAFEPGDMFIFRQTSVDPDPKAFAIDKIDNTDNEIMAALNQEISDRTNADTTLQSAITQVTNDLSTEASRALAAEGVLQTNINSVNSDLSDETLNRTSADSALQTAINDEVIARQDRDSELQTSIYAEGTARSSADTNLQNQIDTVNQNLASEIDNRTAVDNAHLQQINTISSNLDTEITRAETAEAQIATNLSTETTRATNAESALSNRINTLEAANAMEITSTTVVGQVVAYDGSAATDVASNYKRVIGICVGDGAVAGNMKIATNGNVSGFTGLVAGEPYFVGPNGTLVTAPSEQAGYIYQMVAVAINSSTITLQIGDVIEFQN